MVKFLFVGDLHLRGTNPRNRIDDYKEVAKQKLKEVFKIAVDNAVDAILQPGDIFDRPEVGIAVLLEFAEVLKESPVNITSSSKTVVNFFLILDSPYCCIEGKENPSIQQMII